jgi:hypothetical protein
MTKAELYTNLIFRGRDRQAADELLEMFEESDFRELRNRHMPSVHATLDIILEVLRESPLSPDFEDNPEEDEVTAIQAFALSVLEGQPTTAKDLLESFTEDNLAELESYGISFQRNPNLTSEAEGAAQ